MDMCVCASEYAHVYVCLCPPGPVARCSGQRQELSSAAQLGVGRTHLGWSL